MTIKNLLEQKSFPEVISIAQTESLQAAAHIMCQQKVGALLVESMPNKPIGVITEREILCFLAHSPDKSNTAVVKDVLAEEFAVITLDSSEEEAQAIMTNYRVRHLPVIDDGKVVGIISIGDLVKARLQQTAVEVRYLREFIGS